jgi:hypothetical protein
MRGACKNNPKGKGGGRKYSIDEKGCKGARILPEKKKGEA